MVKAVGLFSGGLDSLLAIKLMQEQGIDVIAVVFRSGFFVDDEKKKKLEQTAKKLRFKIKFVELGKDYLDMVRKPKHGYGKNMNPCIDCHAFMLKQASKIKADFIFTGEVLGERPMSQNKQSLAIVEKEAGLKGKLLRPLSAKLLLETEAEKKGLVDREKLLAIQGRSRKPQMELIKKYKIKEYETPSGGCLLTAKEFANKLRDLFEHNKNVSKQDIELLKIGRHFRKGKNKIIVGRDEEENKKLMKLKGKSLAFEVPDIGSPITILQGKDIKLAASLTVRYSDADGESEVKYGKEKLNKVITVNPLSEKEIEALRI